LRRARKEFEAWLTGSSDDVFALARKHAPERKHIVHEGFVKENLFGNLAPTKTKPPLGVLRLPWLHCQLHRRLLTSPLPVT
jgi:hypothetical protein